MTTIGIDHRIPKTFLVSQDHSRFPKLFSFPKTKFYSLAGRGFRGTRKEKEVGEKEAT